MFCIDKTGQIVAKKADCIYGFGVCKGEPRAAKRDRVYASLCPEGNIVFNRYAFEALGQPANVVLLFDEKTSAIGLRAASLEARNGFRVRTTSRGSTKVVHCSRFLRETGVKIERTASFPTASVENGVLVLELKNRVPTPRPHAPAPPPQT